MVHLASTGSCQHGDTGGTSRRATNKCTGPLSRSPGGLPGTEGDRRCCGCGGVCTPLCVSCFGVACCAACSAPFATCRKGQTGSALTLVHPEGFRGLQNDGSAGPSLITDTPCRHEQALSPASAFQQPLDRATLTGMYHGVRAGCLTGLKAPKASLVHAGERWNADTARASCKPSPPTA